MCIAGVLYCRCAVGEIVHCRFNLGYCRCAASVLQVCYRQVFCRFAVGIPATVA